MSLEPFIPPTLPSFSTMKMMSFGIHLRTKTYKWRFFLSRLNWFDKVKVFPVGTQNDYSNGLTTKDKSEYQNMNMLNVEIVENNK